MWYGKFFCHVFEAQILFSSLTRASLYKSLSRNIFFYADTDQDFLRSETRAKNYLTINPHTPDYLMVVPLDYSVTGRQLTVWSSGHRITQLNTPNVSFTDYGGCVPILLRQ